MPPRVLLTEKEKEVATLVWDGMTNRQIAQVLGTSEQVVKNYLRTTFDKLGVWSRLELAIYVAGHGGEKWNRTDPEVSVEVVAEDVARSRLKSRMA